MKTCSICGNDLPTSLDEYGDNDAPVCRNCWFSDKVKPDMGYDPDIEETAAKVMLSNVECDWASLSCELACASCDAEREAIVDEMQQLKREKWALKDQITFAQKVRDRRKESEARRLDAWKNGTAIRGETNHV